MKEKFLKIALAEVGYKEGKNNDNKYGKWYGINNQPWCAMFVSWCANQVGVLKTLVPKYSGCGTGYNWFKNKGLITMKPKAGDIGFLKPTKETATSSHTFIVYKVNGNTITTIDGNYPDGVKKITRKLDASNILGFGSVQWPNEEENTTSDEIVKEEVESTPKQEENTNSVENKFYKVQKGDNLTRICNKYYGEHSKTTINKVVEANKEKYPRITANYIQAGWTLVIPK